MHLANERVWKYFVERYREAFTGARVVEFGSYDINGSIRPLIEPLASEYIGVDWRPGPRVDVVSLAHEVNFAEGEGEFDVVVSASMLEHDPYWRESLTEMVEVLRPGGLLGLTWGNENNNRHCLREAPDRKFHGRPMADVIGAVEPLGIEVRRYGLEEDFECNADLREKAKIKFRRSGLGRGCVALCGFKMEKTKKKK